MRRLAAAEVLAVAAGAGFAGRLSFAFVAPTRAAWKPAAVHVKSTSMLDAPAQRRKAQQGGGGEDEAYREDNQRRFWDTVVEVCGCSVLENRNVCLYVCTTAVCVAAGSCGCVGQGGFHAEPLALRERIAVGNRRYVHQLFEARTSNGKYNFHYCTGSSTRPLLRSRNCRSERRSTAAAAVLHTYHFCADSRPV